MNRGLVLKLVSIVALTLGVTVPVASDAAAAPPVTHYTGTLDDGASWIADVPAGWNGTLVLYSHGFGTLSPPTPLIRPPRRRCWTAVMRWSAPPTIRTARCGPWPAPSATSSSAWPPSNTSSGIPG